jgi:hypothetical protein
MRKETEGSNIKMIHYHSLTTDGQEEKNEPHCGSTITSTHMVMHTYYTNSAYVKVHFTLRLIYMNNMLIISHQDENRNEIK